MWILDINLLSKYEVLLFFLLLDSRDGVLKAGIG